MYAVLLGIGTFLLTLLVAHYSHPPLLFGDSIEYMQLAKNIALGKGFSFDGISPAAYRPPLFSFLLGLWFYFCGTTVVHAIYFQACVLGLAITISFYLFEAVLNSRPIALVGSALLMLNPFIVCNSIFILQEPLLMLLTTFAAVLTLHWLEKKTTASSFIVGWIWGICTLGKVSTLFMPIFLIGLTMADRLQKKSRDQRSAHHLVMLVLGFCITVLPWTYRNYHYFHHIILINDQGLGALKWFVGKGRLANAGGATLVAALQSSSASTQEQHHLLLNFIYHHPVLALSQNLKNAFWFCMIYRVWFETYTHWSMSGRYWIWPALIFYLPLYVGFWISFQKAWKRNDLKILFLGFFYLLYWSQHIFYCGEPRLAMPIFPILLALGIEGWKREFFN